MTTNQTSAQFIELGGQRFVVLPEAEYRRLTGRMDETLPALPPRDARGNYPAAEALQVTLARDILSRRRQLGWTQGDLARRAGVRVETIHRLETGKHAPSVPTIDAVDRALKQGAADGASRKSRKRTSRKRG